MKIWYAALSRHLVPFLQSGNDCNFDFFSFYSFSIPWDNFNIGRSMFSFHFVNDSGRKNREFLFTLHHAPCFRWNIWHEWLSVSMWWHTTSTFCKYRPSSKTFWNIISGIDLPSFFQTANIVIESLNDNLYFFSWFFFPPLLLGYLKRDKEG